MLKYYYMTDKDPTNPSNIDLAYIKAIDNLENRIDDLSRYKVATHELDSVKKDIHNIHLDLAYIKGVLSGITSPVR